MDEDKIRKAMSVLKRRAALLMEDIKDLDALINGKPDVVTSSGDGGSGDGGSGSNDPPPNPGGG